MEEQVILHIKGLCLGSVAGNVIVDNVDLRLNKGEVLGLIGESGAGKSTIGLASMCYARAGVHIAGGEVVLDGVNIRSLDAEGRRDMRGKRIAYIAQSAAAAFNPAHSLMDQVCEAPLLHGLMTRSEAQAWARELSPPWICLTRKILVLGTRTKFQADSCSVRWRLWRCPAARMCWF